MTDHEQKPTRPDPEPPTWFSPANLEVIETHISRVYLGEELVWKTKKPVDLGFLDFTTPEARQSACRAEVELNRRLAPGVYLGVVPVTTLDGEVLLSSEPCGSASGSDPGTETETDTDPGKKTADDADWAVLMRRLPEECRADSRLARGELTPADLDRIAERLASFHDDARCDEATRRFGNAEAVRGNVEENFTQTREHLGEYLTVSEAEELKRWQMIFLERDADLLAAREAAGRVCDGHGDLRLEHVYLDVPNAEDDVLIVDCIEFNDRFRFADVCADVAFLAMDLQSCRRPDLAEAFLGAYARASQDYDLYPLVDFYESYRAFVRAKVALFVVQSGDTPAQMRKEKQAEAREHFLLALSAARRELLPPRLVAVGGWIGAGKSTTARLVSKILDAPIVDADRTRKHLLDVDASRHLHVEPWSGPYSEEMTARTYEELLRRALQVLQSGRSVVVDASFRQHRHRLDARRLAARLGVPFLFVECRAEAEVCRRRLRERDPGPSDGRLEIFDAFVAGYEAPEEATPDGRLAESEIVRLDTDALTLEDSERLLRDRLPSAPPRLG